MTDTNDVANHRIPSQIIQIGDKEPGNIGTAYSIIESTTTGSGPKYKSISKSTGKILHPDCYPPRLNNNHSCSSMASSVSSVSSASSSSCRFQSDDQKRRGEEVTILLQNQHTEKRPNAPQGKVQKEHILGNTAWDSPGIWEAGSINVDHEHDHEHDHTLKFLQGTERGVQDSNGPLHSIRGEGYSVDLLGKQLEEMKKERGENLIQIAKLGKTVLKMEKHQKRLEKENRVLQKLLNASREVALNQSLEMQMLEKSVHDIDDHDHEDAEQRPCHRNIRDLNDSMSHRDVGVDRVRESLEKELEMTKQRESRLLQQMKLFCSERAIEGNGEHANRDVFMEGLLESQQEVITYLTTEVDVLRRQLDEERNRFVTHLDTMQNTKEMLQILERENQLVAEETIKNEKLLEMVRQDLSIKSGENACLREEVMELEQKSARMQERRCSSVGSALDCDAMSEMEESLMTVEIEHGGDSMNPEVQMLLEAKPSDQEVLLRKYQVLKRTLKQKYESKQKHLEEKIRRKEIQVQKLTQDLEVQRLTSKKHQEDLEQYEMCRISNEFEMNQEIEALKSALKARDTVVSALKVKMARMQERCNGSGMTWQTMSGISDALIEGVGRSIELFEALSFVNENDDHDNTKLSSRNRKDHHQRPGHPLSSKSFG